MQNPHEPPSSGVVAEEIFANPDEVLARLDALNERFARGELSTISTEELKERLGLWPDPDTDECG